MTNLLGGTCRPYSQGIATVATCRLKGPSRYTTVCFACWHRRVELRNQVLSVFCSLFEKHVYMVSQQCYTIFWGYCVQCFWAQPQLLLSVIISSKELQVAVAPYFFYYSVRISRCSRCCRLGDTGRGYEP